MQCFFIYIALHYYCFFRQLYVVLCVSLAISLIGLLLCVSLSVHWTNKDRICPVILCFSNVLAKICVPTIAANRELRRSSNITDKYLET
jgi:ABC-type uncharacterized transport system permease subunit